MNQTNKKYPPKRIVPKFGKRFNNFPGTPKTSGEAAAMIVEGERLAETARELEGTDDWDGYMRQKRSDAFISKGIASLEVKEEPHRVTGGELVMPDTFSLDNVPDDDSLEPLPESKEDRIGHDNAYLLDRTQNPDMIGIEASQERLNLADQSDCLEMAIDASESIKGANSLEKMLAHQMAAAHRMAMKLMGQIEENDIADDVVKLVNASARMMTTFQNGMQTLAKVRNGGRQEVLVQHVHVNGDAQAVVAGKMDYPIRGRGHSRGKNEK